MHMLTGQGMLLHLVAVAPCNEVSGSHADWKRKAGSPTNLPTCDPCEILEFHRYGYLRGLGKSGLTVKVGFRFRYLNI
jgi:hypothetical protein